LNVFIDIETIPAQARINEAKRAAAAKVKPPGAMKKAETIAKWNAEQRPAAEAEAWHKTALNGAWGEIVCICWATDTSPVRSAYRATAAYSEGELLARFFAAMTDLRAMSNGREITWVGHNVTGFDLRFIWQRAIVLGVRPSIKLRQDAKPWGDMVFDTMAQWSGRDFIKLTDLCAALSIDVGHEDTIDGSQVWEFFEAGDIKTVLTHCIADVERVRKVHKRMTFG
jgi:hypothetical protein